MKVSGFIGNVDVVSKTFTVKVKVFFYVILGLYHDGKGLFFWPCGEVFRESSMVRRKSKWN
jgi:hypothetical protein